MRSNLIIMTAAVVTFPATNHTTINLHAMRQFYIIKTRKNVFINSDITINARRVDDNNARTIASLTSLPPVVSVVTITATTMAPYLSALMTSSLSAGMAPRSASANDDTPPATSSSAMADDNGDDNNNNGSARGVASAASSQLLRADKLHLPPPIVARSPPP